MRQNFDVNSLHQQRVRANLFVCWIKRKFDDDDDDDDDGDDDDASVCVRVCWC